MIILKNKSNQNYINNNNQVKYKVNNNNNKINNFYG